MVKRIYALFAFFVVITVSASVDERLTEIGKPLVRPVRLEQV
jgi:hypothetical protein